MAEEPSLVIITCWEGQVITPALVWLAAQGQHTMQALITEGAPDWLLAEGDASSSQHLQAQLAVANIKPEETTLVLVGHTSCLARGDADGYPVSEVMTRALTRLHAWYANTAVRGLWVSEDLRVQEVVLLP